MQPIHGNSHYRPQPAQTDLVQQDVAPRTDMPARGAAHGRSVVDQLDLSTTASQLLEPASPGKSDSSPAHQARAAIANHPELADLPFGQVVKALNHGTLDTLVSPPAAETVDLEPVSEEPADPAKLMPSETDILGSTGLAATETDDTVTPSEADGESVDGLPSQTIPISDTDVSLLDLIEDVQNGPDTQQAG